MTHPHWATSWHPQYAPDTPPAIIAARRPPRWGCFFLLGQLTDSALHCQTAPTRFCLANLLPPRHLHTAKPLAAPARGTHRSARHNRPTPRATAYWPTAVNNLCVDSS